MRYYLNHYAHKLICEGRLRIEWLISKEECLISHSGSAAAHSLASFWPDQCPPCRRRKGRRKREGGKKEREKKKIKLLLSSTHFVVSV